MGSSEYINGYIERKHDGRIDGGIRIEGIDLSPITAVMFTRDGETYLWLKRSDKLTYNAEQQCYISTKREPRWEAYLKKNMDGNKIVYKGEFVFLRFRFSITGIWDNVLGKESGRMNLYVERLPMQKQDIITGIIQNSQKCSSRIEK